MARKRANGEGSIRKRKDGRWEGRIVAGHKDNGNPIFRYVLAPTQKELLVKLHQSMELHRDVELEDSDGMTLGEWLDRWLAEYAAGTVRESTLRGHRHYIDHYIKPRLGQKKLSALTTNDVQKLYSWLKQSGRIRAHPTLGHQLSNETICHIHCTLHHALDAAVAAHLIVRNPTEDATVPKPDHPPKQILNNAQLDRFMEVINGDPVWHDFFYTELTTGLRRGEICGLQWRDFDADAGTLQICRTLHQKKGGGYTTGETKTGKGRRKILLPSSTAELLRKRKLSAHSEWIFMQPLRPGQPVDPGAAYRRLKQLLDEAGLPDISFHALRHTFATHALSSGVDAKTLAGILGHTNAAFTLNTYTHVTGDMQRQAAAVVGNIMQDLIGG